MYWFSNLTFCMVLLCQLLIAEHDHVQGAPVAQQRAARDVLLCGEGHGRGSRLGFRDYAVQGAQRREREQLER